MQALVRAQARVRAQSIQTSLDGESRKNSFSDDPVRQAENGWCDSRGTAAEVKSKLQMKQEGALKRERAIVYAQQQLRRKTCSYSKTNSVVSLDRGNKITSGLSWLERWMAAKPWDSKSIDALSDMTPIAAKKYRHHGGVKSCSDHDDTVKIRRNNISKRISLRPAMADMLTQTSSSEPSSDLLYDETATATSNSSSLSSSGTPGSNHNNLEGGGHCYKPNYMNPTESIKAKQRASPHHQAHNIQMHSSVDNLQFYKKSIPVPSSGSIMNRKSADSDLYSVRLYRDLYPPPPSLHFDKHA